LLRADLGLPAYEHESQFNQDIFALLVNRFKAGYFVEVGANDGYTFSNTAYLEQFFGWRGLLIEANRRYLSSLEMRNGAMVLNCAIAGFSGRANFVDGGLYGGLESTLDTTFTHLTKSCPCIEVDCITMLEALNHADAPEIVDFISIDVEGGELAVVEGMVESGRRFRCGSIEYNRRRDDYRAVHLILSANGYRIVWVGQTGHEIFFIDEQDGCCYP
jgi:FkbM family methyltransferase